MQISQGGTLRLRSLCLLQVCLWIATSDRPIPAGMVGPCPCSCYRPAHHGPECARHGSRAFINVNEESSQHHQSGNIMEEIRDPHGGSAEDFWEPHRDPC